MIHDIANCHKVCFVAFFYSSLSFRSHWKKNMGSIGISDSVKQKNRVPLREIYAFSLSCESSPHFGSLIATHCSLWFLYCKDLRKATLEGDKSKVKNMTNDKKISSSSRTFSGGMKGTVVSVVLFWFLDGMLLSSSGFPDVQPALSLEDLQDQNLQWTPSLKVPCNGK